MHHHVDERADTQIVADLLSSYECVRTHSKQLPFQLSIDVHRYTECSVRKSEVERVNSGVSYTVSITVYQGHRRGTASTNSITLKSLHATMAKAIELAALASTDAAAAPVDSALLATYFPDLRLRYSTEAVTPDMAVALARSIESYAFAHHPLITNSEGSSVQYAEVHSLFATENGFYVINASSEYSAGVTVIATSNNAMYPGHYWSHDMESLEALDAKNIGVKAAEDALSSVDARTIKTGVYNLLFTPQTAVSLISAFLGAISGHRLYKKTTFLTEEALGKPLFPTWFTLAESPFLPQQWGSEYLDSDGVGRQQKVLIEDGVLQSHLHDCYSARKTGNQTTGNAGGVTNIELSHSDASFEQLLHTLGRGVIITNLMGNASDLLTGQYSRGARGFFVDRGAIQFPIEGITVSSNFRDMFRNLRACGKDIDNRYSYLSGSWLLNDMVVAT